MTWNKCAVLLWGLTFASNCVDGSVRHRHRIRARRRQIRLERIRRGWSKTIVRKNNCLRIEQSRRTENNNVSDVQQFLKSRFANATTGDLRSQWHKVRTRLYAIGVLWVSETNGFNNSPLKNISGKLAKFELTNAILVEYIQSRQYLNICQKRHQNWWYCLIFNMCGKEVAILRSLWKNRQFERYLSWYGAVNSYKTHLGDVALILLYLLKIGGGYLTRWSLRIFGDSSVTLAQWWRARHLRNLVIRRSPVWFRPKTRQLRFTWIWTNRPSSKGSKLLFPVMRAI